MPQSTQDDPHFSTSLNPSHIELLSLSWTTILRDLLVFIHHGSLQNQSTSNKGLYFQAFWTSLSINHTNPLSFLAILKVSIIGQICFLFAQFFRTMVYLTLKLICIPLIHTSLYTFSSHPLTFYFPAQVVLYGSQVIV